MATPTWGLFTGSNIQSQLNKCSALPPSSRGQNPSGCQVMCYQFLAMDHGSHQDLGRSPRLTEVHTSRAGLLPGSRQGVLKRTDWS